MKSKLLVLGVVTLVWAGVVGAAVHQGELDGAFSGTWFNESAGSGGQSFDGLFLSGSLGYFLTKNVEIEGAAVGIWTSGNPTTPFLNDQDERFYAFGGKAKYHFLPDSQWVPYLGGQFFWGKYHRDAPGTLFDTDLDGILWGPLAGVRFELTSHFDFYVEYQYHIWSGQVSEARSNDVDAPISPNWDHGHLIMLGLIYRFL
jgi:hypothetical protein